MTIPIQDAIMIFKTELEVRSKGYYDYLANGGQSDCAEEAGIDALQLAIKALEIADRLEHVDFTKHKKHYHCNIGDSEWDSGYEIGFINGYNQALADIRGDEE